ncbi:MAG TPA: hypothetical protein VL093_03300 [Flavipsychrobacter sp.]|nr:hypothetical protein [Flavipsychrobacter sp.]
MKRMFYWIVFVGLAVAFNVTPASAQESKYKLKVKGPAAAAYVRHHGYPAKISKSTAYRSKHHSSRTARSTAHVSTKKHASHKSGSLHRSVAYKNSSGNTYAGSRQSYRRSSGAYYTGHRSTQRWDKVKVKRKKDKLVYKFKKDD